ncbi:MAG: hypothetical protein ACYDCI_06250 [Candidatus Limnocylindrales bacterium]
MTFSSEPSVSRVVRVDRGVTCTAPALREYGARHAPDELTDAIDGSVAELGVQATADFFVATAAAHVMASSEW